MPQPAVAAEIHQPLDVHLNFAPEITLDLVVRLEEVTDLLDLRLGQLFRHLVGGYPRFFADASRDSSPHPIKVG
jgi:hypothetical protein